MDKQYFKENLKKFILEGKFVDAKKIVHNFLINELSDTLFEIADDSKTIITYAFVCSLLIDKELHEYHIIAAEILSLPLFSIPGAYNVAVYHAKRALELAPDRIDYKEFLLFFYRIPDQLISKEEALKVAQEIIKEKPTSKAALYVIEELMDHGLNKIES